MFPKQKEKEPPPHHNFEYDKILETATIVLPDSLAMKCNPKSIFDDSYYEDEYPQGHAASASSQSDESERHKSDSGIETDDIDEANKSVGFSKNIQILGEKSVDHGRNPDSKPNGETDNSLTHIDDTCTALNTPDDEPPVRTKREGVIADSIDQKSTRDFDLDLKVYEKSEETENLIKSAIIANDFLNNMMDAERLQALVNAMIPQVLKANSFVIKEGETGNQFFVSAEGEYEVIKDGVCIKTFGPGVVFGELAILYKARRFASIKVTKDAFVWALDRKIFQKIMMKTGNQEHEQNIKFLSSVRILQGVSPEVLHKIADLLKREFYATSSTIIRQGDQGDKFYIIRGGSVTGMF